MFFVLGISAETYNQTTTNSVETPLKDQWEEPHVCSIEVPDKPTTSTPRHGSNTSPTQGDLSQKPPFGCGCGSCTFSSFIERGCPTPFSSTNSFPYLNLSGLTDIQKEDLRERLRFESRKIMMEFQALVSATIKSLIRRKVPLDELVSHVMTLGAFDPVFKKPQVPVFKDCHKKLKAADTIPKVFLVLYNYFSFFNYDIIEHIIEVLGTREDKAELQNYKNKFDEYARRRIYECGPQFGPESETDHASIFVKLDSLYNYYTVAEIKGFCRRLSEILHVSSQGVLRLCQIQRGCIQLTFQVPSFLLQKIFPLSSEQEKALNTEGIIKITCGEYQFPDDQDSGKKLLNTSKYPLVAILCTSKLANACLDYFYMTLSQMAKWKLLDQ